MKRKTIFSFVTATAAAFSVFSSISILPAGAGKKSADEISYAVLWGDTDCNGSVNILDATLITTYIENPKNTYISDIGLVNADVYNTGDGLTQKDADMITKYTIGTIKALPVVNENNNASLWGDVNCDGSVDISDVTLLTRVIGGDTTAVISDQGKQNADVHQPGSGIEPMDSIYITQYCSKQIKVLPQYNTDKRCQLGDINNDSTFDSADASMILTEYSAAANGNRYSLTPEQQKAADVSQDGTIDASDASLLLQYYSYLMSGHIIPKTLTEFIKSNT